MKYRVLVTPQLLVPLLQAGAVIAARCLSGLPSGVRLVDAGYFDMHDEISLWFEDDLPGGNVDLVPVYERIEVPE